MSSYRWRGLLRRGETTEFHRGEWVGTHGFRRRVTFKTLRVGYVQIPELVAQLAEEARLTCGLEHANIVAVLDVVTHERRPFLVMEHVDGATLAERILRKQTLPVEVALHMIAEVGHALAYAHQPSRQHSLAEGVVHECLSPDNVILGVQGDVKVTGFGAAVDQMSDDPDATTRYESFIAPEVSRGERSDPRSDVFSLGCVLHAALTGRSPYRGGQTGSVNIEGWLPEDIRALIARSVLLERTRRYQDAEVFARACAAARGIRSVDDGRSTLLAWLRGLRPRDSADALGRAAVPESPSGRLEGDMQDPETTVVPLPKGSVASSSRSTTAEGVALVQTRVERIVESRESTDSYRDPSSSGPNDTLWEGLVEPDEEELSS